MRCSTGVFHFTSRFSFYLAFLSRLWSRFRYQHVGIQNASENARKMQEKREKNPKSPMRENVSILHYALCKNASQSRFARVLLPFCSRLAHKLYQNANPTHSVIWAYDHYLLRKCMVENVKLRQIIAKIDFLSTFQQKKNFWENLTSGCHGNTFVEVTSKSTNLAKITLLVSLETCSHDNFD